MSFVEQPDCGPVRSRYEVLAMPTDPLRALLSTHYENKREGDNTNNGDLRL